MYQSMFTFYETEKTSKYKIPKSRIAKTIQVIISIKQRPY